MIFFGMAAIGQVNYATDLVNPFVGTGGHGHTFPGACVPNGLVQLSPDTRTDGVMDWDGCGGYHYSDSVIYGFSHTHLSGTGVADLCDVLLTPMAGSGGMAFDRSATAALFDHASEQAYAGYYKVDLLPPPVSSADKSSVRAARPTGLDGTKITVELSATPRVGVHRYTFPAGQAARVVLDLRHRDKFEGLFSGDKDHREIVGERRSHSWATDQRLFYCIRFSEPWKEEEVMPSNLSGHVGGFDFGPLDAPLIVKVGISAVSIEGARANLDAEVPGWDFDAVRKQAEDAWNAKLNKIHVQGGTKEQQRIFYTALYHCYVAPYIFNDVDGKYRGMDGQVHHADHNVYTVFSLWDTFRALHPLMTILEPEMTSDFIKTFLLHYQQGGRLPVWELWGNETDCMIGYHSVSVIADAYMKGIRGFDADLALEAMVASAMRDEPGLNAYRAKGYISSEDQSESVSKTLEYAYDDWCIAQMANAMGKDSLADEFYRRSRSWQNLFDPETRFFRARRNGGFIEPFDPYEVNFHFTEANAWQYSMFVPHDLVKYSELMGTGFYGHLNELFSTHSGTTGRDQADITGTIGQYAHGNEPSHHMAYLYRSGPGYQKVRQILNEMYHDAPDGLSGNEDCGQMSAWYVMSAMGIYPVAPGCDRYWTGITLFDEVDVTLPNGKHFKVYARSMTDTHSAEVEAQPWPSLSHKAIMDGMNFSISDGPRADPKRIASTLGTKLDVIPAPVIRASSSIFSDSVEVFVSSLPGPWRSVVGTEFDTRDHENDPSGHQPWVLYRTGTVRAYNVDSTGHKGPEVTAQFTKTNGSRTITLESTYANQYAAGGDNALIDGLRGGTDFRTGEWQGFEGQDVLATIDLGRPMKVMRVGLSVLQEQRSWIWFPPEVEFAFSANGRQWSTVRVANTVSRETPDAMTAELMTEPIAKRARYVKVIAKNAGPCPEWHPGKGGTTWIFADEVLIETE